MILSFSLSHFPSSILAGKKETTIRRDEKKRWKVGQKIHFWKDSPRNKGSYPFATGKVYSVQKVELDFKKDTVLVRNVFESGMQTLLEFRWCDFDLQQFANTEGFANWEQFKTAFQKLHPGDTFEGRLITWEQPVTPL